jgi:endo-1,4-beta-xylanase
METEMKFRTGLTAVAVVALLGAGVVVATSASAADGVVQDLLTARDWSHLAGATSSAAGVKVVPVGRALVSVEGTSYQPNPPVNLRGPRLLVNGDFRVDATVSVTSTSIALVRLYGQVPVIYDEFRQERPSLQVGVSGGKMTVQIWNGNATNPTLSTSYGSGLTGSVKLSVEHQGANLTFLANGKTLGTQADRAVFASGQVYFGLEAGKGSPAWTLTGLSTQTLGTGTVTVENSADLPQGAPPADSLRTLAGSKLLMGSAIAANELMSDSTYRRVAAQQYSMLTPENDMKPQFVEPQKGVFTFEDGDTLVAYAQANNMKVHAHTLVWGEALPAWMTASMTNDARKAAMLEHIDGVAGHFAGKVAEWDVINEPMSDDDPDYTNGNKGLRPNPWFKAMGEQYIDLALKEARKIDPNAKLFINEYQIENNGTRWTSFLALIKRLQSRGVPLDGVGLQTHEYEAGDRTPVATFKSHLQQIAALGLSVRISEMDVSAATAGVQSSEFSGKLAACKAVPACTSFSTWGFTDRYGSTADTDVYPPKPGDALPFDTAIKPKAAVTAMKNALK